MTVDHAGRLVIRYEKLLLEELVRINVLVNKLLDASNSARTVGRIGHTKPLARGVEHLAGSLTLIDQLVHHPRNQVLSLRISLCLGSIEDLLEILVAVFKVLRCEAPYIHAHRSGDAASQGK